MRVVVDMSPIVHGFRAVKRCTACIVSELIEQEHIDLNLLYIDYKCRTNKYLNPFGISIKKSVIPVPYRLLIPLWKRLSWPCFDGLLSKYDLFYTNEFYFPPSKKTIILATVHGLAYKVLPERMPLEVVKSLNQGLSFLLKHADYLVAVSETTKKELVQYADMNPERIYVVTHGVDKQFLQHTDQQEVRSRLKSFCGLSNPYILYVGAIGIHKNITGILAAYEMLIQEIPHHLVLAGPPDSAWDTANRFVVEKNLTDRVHFLGHVYETGKLVDLYNGADLFVFPSFYEGWTSPPLEAMACGTPVITSNCSSLPETVKDAAVQVNPDDPEELSNQMFKILTDTSFQQSMIGKGFEHVALHTWEKAAEKLINVFEDIMVKGPWEKPKI